MRVWVHGECQAATIRRAILAALDHYRPKIVMMMRRQAAGMLAAQWARKNGAKVEIYPMKTKSLGTQAFDVWCEEMRQAPKPDAALFGKVRRQSRHARTFDFLHSIGWPCVAAVRYRIVTGNDWTQMPVRWERWETARSL